MAAKVTYCIVPRELAPKLHDDLRDHFRDDQSFRVAVERRRGERRGAERRRAQETAVGEVEERRRIRSVRGKRVADRRAPTIAAEPLPLPRKARRYAERLSFVERLEPTDQDAIDVDADRLVIRYQSGDESALTDLYLRYSDAIYSYVRVILDDRHEAEDVSQDVFVTVIAKLAEYEVRPSHPFRAWLFHIARNETISRLRKQNRVQLEEPAQIDMRREAGSPEEVVTTLTWLTDKDVAFFVDRLPAAQREVITLRYMLDMRPEDIADFTGRKTKAVYELHRRALGTLENRLTAIGRRPESRSRRAPTLVRVKRAPVLRARRWALSRSGGMTASSFAATGRQPFL